MSVPVERSSVKPGSAQSRKFLPWKSVALITLAVVAVYGRAVLFDFVTYDDYDLVVGNGPYLAEAGNIFASFTTHVFITHRAESAYYRPLLTTSFILDYHLWGLNPFGYHLINIILHVVAAVVLYGFARRLFRTEGPAVVAALVFALHPIQTESVAWVSGRNDLLLGLFVLLMLAATSRARTGEAHGRLFTALSVVFFALALLTKESAAFYVLLPVAFDLCTGEETPRELLSVRTFRRYLPMGIVFLGYLAIRVSIFGAVIGAEKLYGSTPLPVRMLQVPPVVAEYCSLLLLPLHLSVVHPVDHLFWMQDGWSVAAAVFPVALLAGIWLAWRRDRILCFGLLWFAIGLVPMLDLFPLAVPVLEHRLYVPLAGAAIAGSRGMSLLATSLGRPRWAVPIASALIVIWGFLAVQRLPVWRNSETLWTDAIAKEPGESRSYFNLAGYYFNRQEFARSIPLMEKFVELDPQSTIGYSKLRQLYFMAGRYADAIRVCRRMIALDPRHAARYLETGELFERLRLPDSAAAVYREGVAADSADEQLHERLGAMYLTTGRNGEAEAELRHAVRLRPASAQAYFALGELYARTDRDTMAIATIEEGMIHGTPPVPVLQLLERLYINAGRSALARDLHQRFAF